VTFELATSAETALIVGAGPGLGYALARRFARAGMSVAMAARNAERLDPFARALTLETHREVRAYGCDAANEPSGVRLLSLVARDMGTPHVVVYAVQGWHRGRAIEVEAHVFEECWRQNCLGAFVVAREAARRMAPLKRGTIVLVGSTSGIIGRADHLNLAIGKFGLRALAQVMSRELWPEGIHVVHVIIDADIAEDGTPPDGSRSNPDDIAETIYALHRQSRTAWTSEVDVRPSSQFFWTHC
jgi:NAD(P)-dependent dehydrogenase (short-subunit alcohol dehydrogenase family)